MNSKTVHTILFSTNKSEEDFYFVYNPAFLNEVDNDGYNLLCNAFRARKYNIVEFLVREGIDLSFIDPDGNNVLHYITQYSDRENKDILVNLLELILGTCDQSLLNQQEQKYGNTPLFFSVVYLVDLRFVDLLLTAGSDPFIKNMSMKNTIDLVNEITYEPLKELFQSKGFVI